MEDAFQVGGLHLELVEQLLDRRIMKTRVELLLGQNVVRVVVGEVEDLRELCHRRRLLLHLFLEELVGVLGRLRQRLLQEERGDHPDDGKHNESHVRAEEDGVPEGDLMHQGRNPVWPATTHGNHEHGPESLQDVSVVVLAPEPHAHVIGLIRDEPLDHLGCKDRGDEHE